jgi:mutual gliding-motility protein MglA
MTFINYASREINCKIVYYGPGLCGKTTNLQYIYDSTAPQAKGKLISLATETDRTLFFDFMPLELGTVRGFKTRFAPVYRSGAGLLRRVEKTDP